MVNVTESAVNQIKILIDENKILDAGLRIYISGMGCSGLKYGLALDDKPQVNDEIYESFGLKIYVDDKSHQLLNGSTIDYIADDNGSGFKIDNPNKVPSCSCDDSSKGCCSSN